MPGVAMEQSNSLAFTEKGGLSCIFKINILLLILKIE